MALSIKKSVGLGVAEHTLVSLKYSLPIGSGVGITVHDSRVFYVFDNIYAVNGKGMGNYYGTFVGRLLFRARILIK